MRAFKAIGLMAMIVAAYVLAIAASHAQDWPNRPVRVVVPFGAGGAADLSKFGRSCD